MLGRNRRRMELQTWQQYQFAKTIEWHGASVPQEDVPAKSAVLEDVVEEIDTSDRAPALRRSYTTSALNDFGKLFDNNEAAEAAVLAQVSDSLAEEVQRTKVESASSDSQANSNTSPITTPESVSSVSSEQQLWTEGLTRLANAGHYHEIPGAFHSMLRAGIQQPSPSTYHALLTSVLALTKGKHQRVPKALEVYSDMLQRGVTPDSETFSLPGRASCTTLEHTMLVEDNSNSIAMKIFHRAVASNEQITAQACASLIAACASIGAVNEMGKILQYGKTHSLSMQSSIFPPVIEAYGRVSDLKSAVEAYDSAKLTKQLWPRSVSTQLTNNLLDQSTAAFTTLSALTQDLVEPAVSMLAMHIRIGNVEAAEPYWRIIEAAPANLSFVEPSTMRTVALSAMGQSERGLRQARRMFARIRDSQPESRLSETVDHIAEAIETTGNHLIRSQPILQAEASAELMRAMMDNGSLIESLTLHCLLVSLPNKLCVCLQQILNYSCACKQCQSFQLSTQLKISFDPYIAKTDTKGSNVINELLERGQGRRSMEAMTKFRNMRRVGRVPRMFTYGKLIESAAKENNFTLAREILEMAKQDVPFDARYRVVRFGWQQILDHMISGCLVVGRRDLAASYHQDMLAMVKIFHQAKSEGVEPSSFLYNALIGKLGKARRIDDCLFYFAEMRTLGIRPTSVTYGTIVNALCRVSDEKFAEEIFEEMESCSNYKPRPAPYHSLMQFFLTTQT
ncbi:hypothetical protein MRB53_042095 [Persea americana]|nr:hypothetical protein MRB53_042095 [Persea americana]